MDRLTRKLDTAVYGLIGPFAILHVFPRYFLGLEKAWGIQLVRFSLGHWLGSALMVAGALLAIWCAILMYMNAKGSVSPFTPPTALVSTGPYGWVRHPMMWSINLVLLGEVLLYSSPMILLWLLLWLRFSFVYIARYEEPYLESVFGNAYREYCQRTPQWLPRLAAK
jgi:protein-S-isoprenylcysteine O-methyltransferase Ste14